MTVQPALDDLEREFYGDRQRGFIPDDREIATRLAELEAMLNWPVRAPAARGENVPVIVQVFPGVTVPQVLVCEKLPVVETPEMTKFAVPQLVTTTGCEADEVDTGWLPKFTVFTFRQTAGAVAMPVPDTRTL